MKTDINTLINRINTHTHTHTEFNKSNTGSIVKVKKCIYMECYFFVYLHKPRWFMFIQLLFSFHSA